VEGGEGLRGVGLAVGDDEGGEVDVRGGSR
jgi:hypothetical protein